VAEKLQPYQAKVMQTMLEDINHPQYKADLENPTARSAVKNLVLSAAQNDLALTPDTLDYTVEMLGLRHGLSVPQFEDLVGKDLVLLTPEDAEDRVRVVHVALELMNSEEPTPEKQTLATSPLERSGQITADEIEFDEQHLKEIIISRGKENQSSNGHDTAQDISPEDLARTELNEEAVEDESSQLRDLFQIRHMVELVHKVEELSGQKLDSEQILELANEYKQYFQTLERERIVSEDRSQSNLDSLAFAEEDLGKTKAEAAYESAFENYEKVADSEHRKGLALVMFYEAKEEQVEAFFEAKKEGYVPKLANTEKEED